MNFLLYILLCLNLIQNIFSLHLNNYQIQTINNLIQSKKLTSVEREKINLILFTAFEKLAIKKAHDFKNLHKHKCANIQYDELILYSKMGLFKSIRNFNGKYNFVNYSSNYIRYELLQLLTDKYSLSIMPKSYRAKSKIVYSNSNKSVDLYDKYNMNLDVKLNVLYQQWELDKIFISDEDIPRKINEKYEEIDQLNKLYTFINNQPPFTKRIIYLKYYFYEDKVLSNKHISLLMGCSEETIRKELIKLKDFVFDFELEL